MDNLTELFALPIGLEKVVTFGNISLYGSKGLNEKFIEAISKTKRGKLIIGTVKKMVDEKQIIPCFADSGILSYFKRRISHDTSGGLLRIVRIIIGAKKPIGHPLDYVLAFYDFNSGKIIILISNHITDTFSVIAVDNSITLSLTHEMMHMYAHQYPYKFLSLFKDDLNSYYSNYFTTIFKLKKEKTLENVIEEIYKFLFLKVEIADNITLTGISNNLNKLKDYSTLDKNEFNTVKKDYVNSVRIMSQYEISQFIALAKEKYKYLIVPLYQSYKDVFGKNPLKGCYQEMMYPSEVICGYSDIKMSPKIRIGLKSLA